MIFQGYPDLLFPSGSAHVYAQQHNDVWYFHEMMTSEGSDEPAHPRKIATAITANCQECRSLLGTSTGHLFKMFHLEGFAF